MSTSDKEKSFSLGQNPPLFFQLPDFNCPPKAARKPSLRPHEHVHNACPARSSGGGLLITVHLLLSGPKET